MRALAVLLTAVTVVALVAAVVMAVRWPDIDLVQLVSTGLLVMPSAVVGLVIGWRRPSNVVGPLISLQGTLFAVMFGLLGAAADVVLKHPGVLPALPEVAALDRGCWMVVYLPMALVLLTFPTGHLLTRRWRGVVAGLLAVVAIFSIIATMSPDPLPAPYHDQPNPFGPAPTWLRAVGWALLPVFLALLTASAASMVLRYRRSADRVERIQVRWLALGAWSLPATLLLCWLGLLLFGSPDLAVIGLAVVVVAIPGAVAVAMLRHDLYDVDRALSTAATYSVLSALLLLLLTGTEVVVGAVLGRGSAVVAAVTTAVAAIAFLPVRRRAQRIVDRWLYPMRSDVRQALADLRRDIDSGVAQPEDVEAVLRHALRAPQLRVGYLAPGDHTPLSTSGEPVLAGTPVTRAGAQIGVIDAGRTPASKELISEAADAAASFVELGRLRLGMAQAMAEIHTSRSRLLSHGYQERRMLQRDLHDGAQQRLVALGMSLRLAQRHLHDDGFELDGVLDQAVTQLGTAIAELRTVAAGLRPLALDGGLDAAVRSLTETVPLPVQLATCNQEIPDDIATTAYFVVSEGLSNAIKHAQASQVGVALSRVDGQLVVAVSDDGIGGAQPAGSGLAGLADRVAAASGRLRVVSPPGAGTRLEAVLPCGS